MRGLKFLMPAVVLFGLGTAAMPWLQAPEPVVSEAPEWAPPPLPELVLPGAETSYPETLRRPLFRSTRRPVPDAPVVQAPAPAPPQLVGYRLTGIVSTGARSMILLETPGGSSVQLVEGESVDGWTVESIAETAVILSHGETRVDLLSDAEETSAGSGGRNTRWLPAAGQKQ